MQRFRKLTKVEKHKAKNMYHIIHLLVGIFICVRNNTLTLRKNNMNNCHHEDPEKYFSNKIFRNYCLVFSEFSSLICALKCCYSTCTFPSLLPLFIQKLVTHLLTYKSFLLWLIQQHPTRKQPYPPTPTPFSSTLFTSLLIFLFSLVLPPNGRIVFPPVILSLTRRYVVE